MRKLAKDKQLVLEAIGHEVQLLITDGAGTITYVNDKFCSISGYSKDELIGQTYWLIDENHHTNNYSKDLWQTLNDGKVWQGEVKNKSKGGTEFWESLTPRPFFK